jgi:hypothetical protein
VRNVATRCPPRAELIVPSRDDIEAVFAERLSVAFRVALHAISSSNGCVEDQHCNSSGPGVSADTVDTTALPEKAEVSSERVGAESRL